MLRGVVVRLLEGVLAAAAAFGVAYAQEVPI